MRYMQDYGISEGVQEMRLLNDEINLYWEIWNKDHYEEVFNAGNENRIPIYVKENTVYLETENSRVYSRGTKAQYQLCIKDVYEWGNEECFEHPYSSRTKGEGYNRKRHRCPECWQSLKQLVE